ncbi:hypothetical protein EUGRSUZ_H02243 [Eucalyptus grandis]|uniref:Uncharacterized protein n=2 Tax=Eucalyptus grandis TaxID=71139 RepID=A0ACC3JRE6_EUCGR|nr:hypothetical protein EUGRSUZ_H02243 [Eucalyptus grandis]
MRSATRVLHILLVLEMLSAVFVANEARPFNVMGTKAPVGVACGGFLDGLSLGAIKQARPSPGEGHKFTNSRTLGGIKDSGPSPGEGHKFTNSRTLGGIKDSGPSPGEGHKFTNSETLGGIKDSGPSPGEGHGHVTGTNQ